MSSDASAIHAQTSAILEKLYNKRGQPDRLNKAFIQEYFKLVKDHLIDLNLDDEAEVARAPLASRLEEHIASVNWSEEERNVMTEFVIPVKMAKFLISSDPSDFSIVGECQVYGFPCGKGTCIISYIKHLVHITIRGSNSGSLVTFVGFNPSNEYGFDAVESGEWVKI